jgi:hypothetical protein
MEQESLPADAGEQPPEHRYLRYPSISTINRRVAAGTDVRQKIRYFRKLIIRLDGDIGERELLLRELRLDGEPEDAPRRELEIDRLKHLRNYVAAQLEYIQENPLDDSGEGDDEAGAVEPSNDDPAEGGTAVLVLIGILQPSTMNHTHEDPECPDDQEERLKIQRPYSTVAVS